MICPYYDPNLDADCEITRMPCNYKKEEKKMAFDYGEYIDMLIKIENEMDEYKKCIQKLEERKGADIGMVCNYLTKINHLEKELKKAQDQLQVWRDLAHTSSKAIMEKNKELKEKDKKIEELEDQISGWSDTVFKKSQELTYVARIKDEQINRLSKELEYCKKSYDGMRNDWLEADVRRITLERCIENFLNKYRDVDDGCKPSYTALANICDEFLLDMLNMGVKAYDRDSES